MIIKFKPGLRLPITLKDPNSDKRIYIYDSKSIDIDVYRNKDVFSIGFCREEEVDIVLEKLNAISQIMAQDLYASTKPKSVASAVSMALSGTPLTADWETLMKLASQELYQTNRLVKNHCKSFSSFIRQIKREGTDLQNLVWELTQYIPPEYYDLCKSVLDGTYKEDNVEVTQ